MTGRIDDHALLDLATGEPGSHAARARALARTGGIEGAEAMPLGERDAALMRLRAARLGPTLTCVETCPNCGALLEFDLATDDLLAGMGAGAAATVTLSTGSHRLRALTAADLEAAAGLPREAARAALASAAAGAPVDDPADIAAVEARLEAADPLAHVALDLACAACGAGWQAGFDIVALMWAELRAAGQGLMREIHALASAYHWSEAEILAVPAARRRRYLDMIGS